MLKAADIFAAPILVVDDLEINVRLLEATLAQAGYKSVRSTTEPREVCSLHREHRFSLILLDIQMPGMSGFEVMTGLRSIEEDGYLPVIVLTAQPGHKMRALEAGARDFVAKPFDLAEILVRVRNMLEVRLLHLEAKRYSALLEETVRELEASREVIRLQTLEEKRRTAWELALAQETQESLLPRTLPLFDGFNIRAYCRPTRFVGGDFYDVLPLDSGHWAGVLADVSGKGMPAALLSSLVLGALSAEFRAGTQPGEALNRMNRLLCEKSMPAQFATLFLFVMSPEGLGQFISAGHNPAWLYRSHTGKVERLVTGHYALGMFDFALYQSHILELSKGDMLVVYSDGLTDAEDAGEQPFGEERLLRLIREQAPSGSRALERGLLDSIETFTKGVPQTDDITFLVAERHS